jgi:hypothetical protein
MVLEELGEGLEVERWAFHNVNIAPRRVRVKGEY